MNIPTEQLQSVLPGISSGRLQYRDSKSATELKVQERENEVKDRLFDLMDEAQSISKSDCDTAIEEITTTAADEIRKLLLVCLRGLPLPEFAILEDGGVSIEWFGKNEECFAINSRGSGRLAFSGWFDNDGHVRGHFSLTSLADLRSVELNVTRVTGG